MKSCVTIRLSKVLQLVFSEVAYCYYRIDQETKEEFVRVTCHRAIGNTNFFDICVTADSAAALVDDVWKECKRRFA